MAGEPLLYEKQGSVAYITLNRPEVLNAFNGALVAALDKALDEVANDAEVRVCIMRGNGRAFTAGFDLKETMAAPITTVTARRADTRHETSIVLKIWQIPKPFIAQIHGYCLGGGMELACLCDLVVAGSSAKFGSPAVKFGFMPQMWLLPWVVGMRKAREISYMGEYLDADEALRIGLVNKVVPDDQLASEVETWAQKLVKIPEMSLTLTKEGYNRNYELAGFNIAQTFAQEYYNQCRLNAPGGTGGFSDRLKTSGLKAAVQDS